MNTKLYVGNLSYSTSEDSLRQAFGQFGTVTDVHVASDRVTGRPRGFGFVTLATAEDAQAATQNLNGSNLDGRSITVNAARPREEGGGRTFAGSNYNSRS